MRRLLVVVEGQSEESFVRDCLAPHLRPYDVDARPIVVTTSRDARTTRKRKGGGRWRHWAADLRKALPDRRDPDVRVTTMFDLYGLPDDFPDLATIRATARADERARLAEIAIADALAGDRRLIPYVQLHEFEALVLAALDGLAEWLETDHELEALQRLRQEIGDTPPESVNDGETTAPSKRIRRHIPSFVKPLHGTGAIETVGLPAVRSACPRLSAWVAQLEGLGRAAADPT